MLKGEKKSIETSTSLRQFLTSLSLTEVRMLLQKGTLVASLKAHSPSAQDPYQIALLSAKEKYWKDATILSLVFGIRGEADEVFIKRELILEYALDTGRLSSCYNDSDDPELPILDDAASCYGDFGEMEWDKLSYDIAPERNKIVAKKLHYVPRGRVSFLVGSNSLEKEFVFKIVASRVFTKCLYVASQLKKSQLKNRLVFPRLIYHSKAKQLFIYRYIPGVGIDSFPADKTTAHMKSLFERVIETLSLIHQTNHIDLPSWDPEIETRIMGSLLNHLFMRTPEAHTLVAGLLKRIEKNFYENNREYPHLIHNDFRTKHLLCDQPASRSSPSITKLSLIDWDNAVLGPKEKDIALFLYTYTRKAEEWRFFLQIYQAQLKDHLDLEFVNHLIQYRFLIKRSRDFLRNKITLEAYFNHVEALTKQLDRNPLS